MTPTYCEHLADIMARFGGIFAGLMLWLAWEIAHAMEMPE